MTRLLRIVCFVRGHRWTPYDTLNLTRCQRCELTP